MSALLVPPGGELCVFLLGDEEVEEERRVKEVGCQWESPEGEKKEVGCQSEPAERRDAGVQVDLLSQQLTDSSGVLLQCLAVRPDGPHGGALLQHCTTKRTTTSPLHVIPTDRQTRSGSRSSSTKRSPSSNKIRQKPGPRRRRTEPATSTSAISAARRSPSLRRRRAPRWRQQEEEDLQEGGGEPTWTSPEGGAAPHPSPSPLNGVALVLPACAENEGGDVDAEKPPSSSTVCDVCGKVMKCKSSLARHSFIHTGQKPYACSLCHLRFNRRDNLQHHLNHLHPNGVAKVEKPRADSRSWLCAVCGKTFNCRSRLRTHEVIHSGVKPHRCPLCPKAYMRINDLEHHKKIVHVGGAAKPPRPCSLLCDLCGREFKSKSQLTIHYQTHTGERPHRCDACGRKFARAYQLKRHKILIHANGVAAAQGELSEASLSCTVCGKRLKSEAHLASHSHLHSGDKPHRCSFCLRGFHRRISLKQHHARMHQKLKVSEASQLAAGRKRSPSAPKLFSCLNCGKVFKFKSLLASHSVIHSDLRPHACEFCSRRFRRLSHLKRHREVVHANGARLPQTFVCHICGKDKKCRSQLERHVIIHTGERPYGCELCAARFNRHGNLKQHKKRMHGVGGPPTDEATPILSDGDDDDLTAALMFKQEETVIAVNDSEPGVREEVVS